MDSPSQCALPNARPLLSEGGAFQLRSTAEGVLLDDAVPLLHRGAAAGPPARPARRHWKARAGTVRGSQYTFVTYALHKVLTQHALRAQYTAVSLYS